MASALEIEIRLQRAFFKKTERVNTIYFGGGTPSIFDSSKISKLLDAIHNVFEVDNHVEITLEANPDDVNKENLLAWKAMGINRLSIGVQSFQNEILKFCNRSHGSIEALESISLAQDIGITNLSIDLMYGMPNPLAKYWENDVDQALALKIPHISAYCLTIEPRTVFGKQLSNGILQKLDEDLASEDYELLTSKLAEQGYDHYEVSNFALPGSRSLHNSNYWTYQPYLGIGPSAHSFDGDVRYSNISNNQIYISQLEEGVIPNKEEELTVNEKIGEYLLTTLRTQWGADLSYLQQTFNHVLSDKQKEDIANWIDEGLAHYAQNNLILTNKGRLLADHLTMKLLP